MFHVERLSDESLDDRLTAHIEVLRGPIQLLQHRGGHVHIDALNRLNHATLALEETGNILALIRETRDTVGGNRLARFTSFLHVVGFPLSSTSTR